MSGIFAPSAPIKFDANGNVLANINAQNINPTIANAYLPILLSHQTGLSITASTAGTFYAIGSAISVPRSGIVSISLMGHVSAGSGYIQLVLTRGSNSYSFGNTTTSLFVSNYTIDQYVNITNSSSSPLYANPMVQAISGGGYILNGRYPFVLPVYSGDSLQLYATNGTANDITYVDDLLVILQ
ncbi:MAG: hypothetical protein QXV17_12020 [Candidatus Micrarchaeaceae archaeon]